MTPAPASPGSPRRSPRPLNRELILDGAMALIEREGAGALSMRRLGSALGVEAMAIYHHFENRGELLRAIGDRLLEPLAELDLSEDWREACRRFATGLRDVAVARPATFALLGLQPFDTPASLRRVEALLGVLLAAGFSPPVALGIYRATVSFARGYALAEATGFTVDASQAPGRRRLRALSPPEFPVLAGRRSELAELNPDDGYQLGLEALLRGLADPNPRCEPRPGCEPGRPGCGDGRPTMTGSIRRASDWLAASKLGLVVMALIVGVGGGLAAAGFRELIYLLHGSTYRVRDSADDRPAPVGEHAGMEMTATAWAIDGQLRHVVDINGRHSIITDEPESLGGTDLGPAPHELLPAMLASCVSTMIHLYARNRGWELHDVRVEVVYDPEPTPRRAQVRIHLPAGLTWHQVSRLRRVAETCPARRALEAGFSFDEQIVTGEPDQLLEDPRLI